MDGTSISIDRENIVLNYLGTEADEVSEPLSIWETRLKLYRNIGAIMIVTVSGTGSWLIHIHSSSSLEWTSITEQLLFVLRALEAKGEALSIRMVHPGKDVYVNRIWVLLVEFALVRIVSLR